MQAHIQYGDEIMHTLLGMECGFRADTGTWVQSFGTLHLLLLFTEKNQLILWIILVRKNKSK
jgi:hypothetical protein